MHSANINSTITRLVERDTTFKQQVMAVHNYICSLIQETNPHARSIPYDQG